MMTFPVQADCGVASKMRNACTASSGWFPSERKSLVFATLLDGLKRAHDCPAEQS
jgi:hypothetical protein